MLRNLGILLFVFTCNRNYINKLHTKKKMIMNINYLNKLTIPSNR